MNETLQQFWRARLPRERAILAGGGTLVLVVFLYLYIWAPMVKARARLRTALPVLVAQAQAVRHEEKAVLALKSSAPVASISQAQLQSAISQSARGAGLTLGAVIPEGSGALTVRFASVPFDDWIRWLGRLQRRFGIRVKRAQVRPAGPPGWVSVDVSLAAPEVDAQ
ncbi:MAG: type II secretion system protein M [Betaproteobacteria bacterium]|nr:type II secretion system protein M [Betaproteobacteria bacterium]